MCKMLVFCQCTVKYAMHESPEISLISEFMDLNCFSSVRKIHASPVAHTPSSQKSFSVNIEGSVCKIQFNF